MDMNYFSSFFAISRVRTWCIRLTYIKENWAKDNPHSPLSDYHIVSIFNTLCSLLEPILIQTRVLDRVYEPTKFKIT